MSEDSERSADKPGDAGSGVEAEPVPNAPADLAQPYPPPNYPYGVFPPPKKTPTLLIVGIVVGVVLLLVASFAAIAIPSFFQGRRTGQDRISKRGLQLAYTAEKIYFVDNQRYGSATEMQAADIEKDVNFVSADPVPGQQQVKVALANEGAVCLTVRSHSGHYFSIGDIVAPGSSSTNTYYFSSNDNDPLADCTVTKIRTGRTGTFPTPT